jgi:hypothetical protein
MRHAAHMCESQQVMELPRSGTMRHFAAPADFVQAHRQKGTDQKAAGSNGHHVFGLGTKHNRPSVSAISQKQITVEEADGPGWARKS